RINGGSLRENLFEKIYSRQVDFGLMVIESYPPEFKVDPLFCSDMVLISPTSGPYAVPQLPSLEQLTQLPFIYHPDNSSLEPFIQHQFARHGLTLRAGHMVSHCGALKKYVAQGMGVAIIDGFACTQEDRLSLNIVSLASFFPQRSFGIVRRRDMYMAEHVEAFLRFLLNNSGGNGESCAPDMGSVPPAA
ncbi:LysR family transcriptional regulator substrate-binding protein, partial [Desulfovibrio sp. OttesenSCG-928-C06]|nr:LysR family transcriptional regulator substrate-binding protein [Desulfovibrio sp. OttesenSCG-928-C06]